MPFWNDSKTQNYKAKLEHKMCIAKEAPDENFDLSDCNLSDVSRRSLLQHNHISNLNSGGSLKDLNQLLILNLKNNKLSSLPSEISLLTKLKVLDLENNQLKKLPPSFENLVSLCHLNLKSNKLVHFPMPICSLYALEYLNLSDNPKIKSLPKELSNLSALKELHIDAERFIYPNKDICVSGTETLMKFLCEEMGTDYTPNTTKSSSSSATPDEDLTEPDKKLMEFSPLSASYL
ncbi:hypothetical protein CEXT_625281 [Caerostris extrusa]|uniref:Disease resistance R13L4/SHOC-2-like LRR domain-containing protein n=1 Tax=Caerostris extrusa TaxID=172846 RepID=A0AAV4NEN8_CAEEX|nr:hypothetical protein CEXT_625281 [Caerostris extrusa]